ncbi:hypothetical protein [Nonomuraea sp. bgisy101]|uniref:hypothetical protein n=1 Tax=Nonomuraea sp. bgisy101 TaxID=3413784 RepID=UPI003D71F3C5
MQIERLAGAVEALFEREFTATTTRRLPVSAVAALEDLITVPHPDPDGDGEAGATGARSFLEELVKLERGKGIGLPENLFEGVSGKVVEAWRARAHVPCGLRGRQGLLLPRQPRLPAPARHPGSHP